MKRLTIATVVATALLVLTVVPAFGKPGPGQRLSLKKGLPSADGLGKLVILSNLPKRGPAWDAVKSLGKYRDAKILWFKEEKIRAVEQKLRSLGPEYVALAVTPETVDMNFQIEVLELCRGLDSDPMPDFHFGYVCARNGDDLQALVDRVIRRESLEAPGRAAKVANVSPPGTHLAKLDYILHFGHGQAWCVQGGMTGEQVGKLTLPKGPVVFSGACFTGVLSRSFHPCAYQMIYLKPQTVAPERLMTLNWVRAGVTGYLAALEGDRGEMAMAEWDYFRERACTLGETIGFQYRLAFTSLPAGYEFPRYIPGRKKLMSFYNVMLRGMISRILLSDPSYRPLRKPLETPAAEAETVLDKDAGTLTVTVEVKRWSQGHFLNYLPKSGRGVFDRRVYRRIQLPEGLKKSLGDPAVTARQGGAEVPLTRFHVKHEVWGGARFVNLQAESESGSLAKAGSKVTFVFPLVR